MLLEYRSLADPDAEFIPKTVAGFSAGALAMGLCLVIAELAMDTLRGSQRELAGILAVRLVFMTGIIGVSASLLLVGLNVRANHSTIPLYARHWLNSMGTGAVFAVLAWGPWFLHRESFLTNHYAIAAIWMTVMAFPTVAARWTIGPHPESPVVGPDNGGCTS